MKDTRIRNLILATTFAGLLSVTALSCILAETPPVLAMVRIDQCDTSLANRDLLVSGIYFHRALLTNTEETIPQITSLETRQWQLLNDETLRNCDEVKGEAFEVVERVLACPRLDANGACEADILTLSVLEKTEGPRVNQALMHKRNGSLHIIGEAFPFTGIAVRYLRDNTNSLPISTREVNYKDGYFAGTAIDKHPNGTPARIATMDLASGRTRIENYTSDGGLYELEVDINYSSSLHQSLGQYAYIQNWDTEGHMTCRYKPSDKLCDFHHEGSVIE